MERKTYQLPMTDQELKEFLKEKEIDPQSIIHRFEANSKEDVRSCITCDYVVLRCWLCDQCISCCKISSDKLE